jgi:hypothetical protein
MEKKSRNMFFSLNLEFFFSSLFFPHCSTIEMKEKRKAIRKKFHISLQRFLGRLVETLRKEERSKAFHSFLKKRRESQSLQ